MVSNDNFILTVTKGSVLCRANGNILLDEIPENVFELWKEGEYVFAMKKTGSSLLENLSKEELEAILEKRKNFDYQIEIKLLEDAIKTAGKLKKSNTTETDKA